MTTPLCTFAFNTVLITFPLTQLGTYPKIQWENLVLINFEMSSFSIGCVPNYVEKKKFKLSWNRVYIPRSLIHIFYQHTYMKIHWKSADISQILITRSCPMVSNLRLETSKFIPTTLCLASWKDAKDDWLDRCRSNWISSVTVSPGGNKIHHLLFRLQLYMTLVADSHFELEAHRWYRYSLRRAAGAQRASAMTTMVLPQSQLPLVHHCFYIPEEGSSACLRRRQF